MYVKVLWGGSNEVSFYIQIHVFHLRRLLSSIYSQYPLQDNDPLFFHRDLMNA